MKTRLLLLATLLSGMSESYSQNCSIAEYYFKGNAADSSGNSYDGVNMGAVLTNDRNGIANSAYLFNGSNSFISLNNNNAIINTTVFTITAWVQLNGSGGGTDNNNPIYVQRQDATMNTSAIGFIAENNAGKTLLAVRTYGNAAEIVESDAPSYGSWHHYAAVCDGNYLKLYLDGTEVASNNFTQSSGLIDYNIDHVEIGRQVYLSTVVGLMNGVIDEVKIFDCALDNNEILDEVTASITEISDQNEVIIFPNPSSDKVYISSEFNFEYNLINHLGEVVLSGQYLEFIDVQGLASGVYIIELQDTQSDYLTRERVIIK